MDNLHYAGLDVHKKTIAFCIKLSDGQIVHQGIVSTNKKELAKWAKELPDPCILAMEATMFTGWIFDFLKPFVQEIKVGHPEMLKAIVAGKKKNDQLDATKIADLLRCNLFPECYMAPTEIRELRRVLRYRNMILCQSVKMKNKISGLLMEVGEEYDKKRLHGQKYFAELLERLDDVPQSVIHLLKLSRSNLEIFKAMQKKLLQALQNNPLLQKRVELLMTIPGIGEVTALTWALEIGEPHRMATVKDAISYCGLCSAQKESAGKNNRGPISKKRNKHLQHVIIETAKLAPRWNEQLAAVHAKELANGAHRNTATLAVARKLVAYLLAVDKQEKPFTYKETKMAA
jgi:transposase